MSELRRDPVSGQWVVVAPERVVRPEPGEVPGTAPGAGRSCPFCPGNEDLTPPELLGRRPEGVQEEAAWQVRVFPNRVPALRVEALPDSWAEGPYDRKGGLGAHEVIVESPDHEADLADLSEGQIVSVLETIRARARDLKRDVRLQQILVYRNRRKGGAPAAVHPHSQLLALPHVTSEMEAELRNIRAYREMRGRCLYCDLVREEERVGTRVVIRGARFLVVAPFASRHPFELSILPRQHSAWFDEGPRDWYPDLAGCLRGSLLKLRAALDDPDYDLVVRSGPCQERDEMCYHWHVDIIPLLVPAGAPATVGGVFVNHTLPEDAARFLSGRAQSS